MKSKMTLIALIIFLIFFASGIFASEIEEAESDFSKLDLLLAGEDSIFWGKSSIYIDVDQRVVSQSCKIEESSIKTAFSEAFTQKEGFLILDEADMGSAVVNIKLTSAEIVEDFCVIKSSIVLRFKLIAEIPNSEGAIPGGAEVFVDYYWPIRFDVAFGEPNSVQNQVVDYSKRAGSTLHTRVWTAIGNMFDKFPEFMERIVKGS